MEDQPDYGMLDITEVTLKAKQGLGGAYQCIGDDGSRYWVKGHNAERKFQVNEWVTAHLAEAFSLPIASFRLVHIDEQLHLYLPTDFKEIGFGPAFASKDAAGAAWFMPETMHPPETLQQDLLVFDYWVQNEDRTNGNPNLLWLTETGQLVVIDHNLAFDEDFSTEVFFGATDSDTQQPHIFHHLKDAVFTDLVKVDEYKQRMSVAMSALEIAFSSIPDEWYYSDLEQHYSAEIDLDDYRAILNRYQIEDFWSIK